MSKNDATVEEVVERAVASKQPPFNDEGVGLGGISFGTILQWAADTPPPYEPDTRELDRWLVEFVRREPHMGGVVAQATSLVRNRGWSLTGGRNTVTRAKTMMHDADRRDGAPRGEGYRHYITRIARSYYIPNIGAISENGRDAPPRMADGTVTSGPLRAMWSTDPTRFRLRPYGTKAHPLSKYPLAYYPQKGKVQYWTHADYFRVVANPSLDDRMMGAGYSPVAIARELAEIMTAVYAYDKEQLGARAPRGLLLLQNIDEEMWRASMAGRKIELDAEMRERYGGLAVLAQMGLDQIDAKIIALSSLPAEFDRREMIDLLMYLYALVFGFSPDEFWPVQGGSFGRGAEARLGVEQATRKGDMDFFSAFQEKLQAELPAIVLLEYEERDDRGRRIEADIAEVHARIAQTLYEAGQNGLEGSLLTKQQAISYLVSQDIKGIEPEWSDAIEDITAEDTDIVRVRRLKERLLDTSEQVRTAMKWQERKVKRSAATGEYDIVRYQWPSTRVQTLWPASEWPHYQNLHPVPRHVKRAVLFRDEETGLVITDDDVDTAVSDGSGRLGDEFAQILEAEAANDA